MGVNEGQKVKESKKISKDTLPIIIVLCILFPAVFILAGMHRETMEERFELQTAGEFLLTFDEETISIALADLLDIGAVHISSSPRGERRDFTGVPLAHIFNRFDVDYSDTQTVVFTSLDGFVTGLTIAEALNEENAFIVFEEDGEPLGTREEGGLGPYMVVVALDPFPNRWARYLMEITLQ